MDENVKVVRLSLQEGRDLLGRAAEIESATRSREGAKEEEKEEGFSLEELLEAAAEAGIGSRAVLRAWEERGREAAREGALLEGGRPVSGVATEGEALRARGEGGIISVLRSLRFFVGMLGAFSFLGGLWSAGLTGADSMPSNVLGLMVVSCAMIFVFLAVLEDTKRAEGTEGSEINS